MNWAAIMWLVLMVVFLWIETASVSMTSLWFAAGSLAGLITSLLHGPLWLQVSLFVVVSGLLLWLLRPIAKKYFTPRLTATNVDAVVGSEGVVSEEIDNLRAVGTVKLGALQWSARSTSGEILLPGTPVKVDGVEGVKVFVSPMQIKEKVSQEV